ncbi:hypothetical protein NL676_019389 [Syzygium grande]|nr:hypothetical protein NL676_019389 [Syzygium grande]
MGIEEIERGIPFSSSSVHPWKFDVHKDDLCSPPLPRAEAGGFCYFENNDKVETGILIEAKLLDAIRHAKVSLVVFTTTNADLRCCLNELVEILKRNRRFRDHQGHVVLPIFSMLSHVTFGNRAGYSGMALEGVWPHPHGRFAGTELEGFA